MLQSFPISPIASLLSPVSALFIFSNNFNCDRSDCYSYLSFDDEPRASARDELGCEKLVRASPAVPPLKLANKHYKPLPPFAPAESIVMGCRRYRRTTHFQPTSARPKSPHISGSVPNGRKRVEVFDGKHTAIAWFGTPHAGHSCKVLYTERGEVCAADAGAPHEQSNCLDAEHVERKQSSLCQQAHHQPKRTIRREPFRAGCGIPQCIVHSERCRLPSRRLGYSSITAPAC